MANLGELINSGPEKLKVTVKKRGTKKTDKPATRRLSAKNTIASATDTIDAIDRHFKRPLEKAKDPLVGRIQRQTRKAKAIQKKRKAAK